MLNLIRRFRPDAPPSQTACGLRPNRDVLSVQQDGMTVLLDLRREVFLGVDEVGSVVWEHIERGASPADIERELERVYDAPPELLRRDVARFIDDLVQRRLVVPA